MATEETELMGPIVEGESLDFGEIEGDSPQVPVQIEWSIWKHAVHPPAKGFLLGVEQFTGSFKSEKNPDGIFFGARILASPLFGWLVPISLKLGCLLSLIPSRVQDAGGRGFRWRGYSVTILPGKRDTTKSGNQLQNFQVSRSATFYTIPSTLVYPIPPLLEGVRNEEEFFDLLKSGRVVNMPALPEGVKEVVDSEGEVVTDTKSDPARLPRGRRG